MVPLPLSYNPAALRLYWGCQRGPELRIQGLGFGVLKTNAKNLEHIHVPYVRRYGASYP